MELATINNSAENEFIWKLGRDNKPTTGNTFPWIGLKKERGQWRWRNSEAVTYTNWIGNPGGLEDCVLMDVGDGFNGVWLDDDCSQSPLDPDDRENDLYYVAPCCPFVCSKILV